MIATGRLAVSRWAYILLVWTFSVAASEGTDSVAVRYASLPAQPGERCTVCGIELTSKDVALMVKGRRVPLNAAMVNEFLQHQEKYFARLQPKAALFQEELDAPPGTAQGGVSSGWFFLGVYILAGLVCGGLSAYAGIEKGLKPIPNFFIGFFFIILGYIYVLAQPRQIQEGKVPRGFVKVPLTSAPLRCPKCGASNHPTATRCFACHTDLSPNSASEVSRAL